MKNLSTFYSYFFDRDKLKTYLFFILIFLSVFSVYALKPQIAGDSWLYVNSIKVLTTGIRPVDFIPMMIVSTYLGLKLIMLLNYLTGNLAVSWIILDSILYVSMGMIFYSLLKKIIGDSKVAFLGTLFLVTNYSAVSFGLGYLMDIGGWVAYVASLYFSYRYLESEVDDNKWIYISSAVVGIGGLYKEYSFVACIVIAGVIIWKNWKNWKKIFLQGLITIVLAFTPILVLNIYGYYFYHYTYLDWFIFNQGAYAYQNRVVEFIKSFGSIYNFGWFLFIGGFYLLFKRSIESFKNKSVDKNMVFIWLVAISCLAVLLWPVVTRVLFITMPAVVMVSSLYIKKIEKYFYITVALLVLYIFSSYLMDAYILDAVSLHSVFNFL